VTPQVLYFGGPQPEYCQERSADSTGKPEARDIVTNDTGRKHESGYDRSRRSVKI
jgi:hypothetical protein